MSKPIVYGLEIELKCRLCGHLVEMKPTFDFNWTIGNVSCRNAGDNLLDCIRSSYTEHKAQDKCRKISGGTLSINGKTYWVTEQCH